MIAETAPSSRFGATQRPRFGARLCAVPQSRADGCYGRRMLHHVVTFTLKPDAPADQVERIREAVTALAATLPEVRSMAVGADLGLRAGNASFAIAAQFDDVDAFTVYADHPEHVRLIKELIAPHISERHPVQFTA
jgi:antibiotic biosynthesis monooxygenase (ABM) superfamily enzyme